MDKWEESIARIKNGMLAEEPDAALAGALELFADFGRTLERIAIALESRDVEISGEPAPIEHDL